MAVIPDTGSGVFHGCYSKITGALRLIDPSKGQNCKSTEKAISWDQSAVVWRGNWKASVSYSSHDAVAYQGSSYVATVANAGQSPPTHPGDWLVLAQAGPKGAVGQAGPPGSPGRGGLLPGELTLGVGVPVILNSADYGFSNVVAIASDGSHVWVVNTSGDSVTEIDGQDGSLVQLLSGGRYAFNQPTAIAFDGSHLWITNGGGRSVTEINASDGSWIRTLTGGNYGFSAPVGISYDGSHLWITNSGANSVTEVSAADGSWIRTLTGGNYGFSAPVGISYDGSHLWITNSGANSVTEVSAAGRIVDPNPDRRKLRIQRPRGDHVRRQLRVDRQ